MGFLDKLMFWKKKDDFGDLGGGLDDLGGPPGGGLGPGLGAPGEKGPDLGLPGLDTGLGAAPGLPPAGGEPPMPGGPGGLPGMEPMPPEPSMQSPPPMEQAPPLTPIGLQPVPETHAPSPHAEHKESMANQNMEIISLKLDAIKKGIEVINVRLKKLEQMAEEEPYESKPRPRW